MSWESLSWVNKVRKLVATACDFYISPYFSSASLERLTEDSWLARFYYATFYIEVYANTEDRILSLNIYDYSRIRHYDKSCRVEGGSLDL